jgi:hypothetical protein
MGNDPDVMITAIFENRAEGGQIVYKGPRSRYSESILAGLRVYHNPHAKHPLDRRLFNDPEIFQATSTGPVNLTILNDSRRNLVNRMAISFRPGTMKKALESMPAEQNFWWRDR